MRPAVHRLRRRIHVGTLVALLVCTLAAHHAAAFETIRVPFGLQWGMTEERIARHIDMHPIQIAGKRFIGGREEWTLTGFDQENLARVLLYFDVQAGLQEVELQYQVDGWTHEKYRGFMAELKRRFLRNYGADRVVEKTRTPHAGSEIFVETREWKQSKATLRLMHFSARRKTESYDNLSVHYCAPLE